ncbi:hypothetical protein BY458DRAFT_586954 [Sporodiniella umbellata]|nr:hypothetical protein BY458DRAFT_586954 [Sporodiniella umbellata]
MQNSASKTHEYCIEINGKGTASVRGLQAMLNSQGSLEAFVFVKNQIILDGAIAVLGSAVLAYIVRLIVIELCNAYAVD